LRVLGRIIKTIIILCIALVLIYCGVTIYRGYNMYQEVTADLPMEVKIGEIKADPDYVGIEEISPYFKSALLAVEDHNFYTHKGVSLRSIARAVVTNISEKRYSEGGSTITQQLAKNMYLSFEKKMERKVAEVFIAFDLEKACSKDEILELYVNIIYFGDGYDGIGEASMGYFGKEPADLSFDEATLLAGLPKAPSNYGLSSGYEKARERQQDVLEAMLSHNVITDEEIEELMVSPQ